MSWARLDSFCHLGFISDPLIVSKFHNETHDPKGQENKNLHYSEGQGDVLPPPHSPSHNPEYQSKMSPPYLFPIHFQHISKNNAILWPSGT